ncbi:unnamed protein product [Vitrella brassicaformis CCMP3155]|uniref:Uncharacterized protein n=2 Tax=Vitrella brassicaformis TaxID=1169539 RepID=A0A0G4EDT0_VITBC|nr:unnamed protein product [Vitrella brassicaformis CCMP3155]|eukprot:CEL94100.1 unnamed protein product [Vitrella brassicaformis CCMP3155]
MRTKAMLYAGLAVLVITVDVIASIVLLMQSSFTDVGELLILALLRAVLIVAGGIGAILAGTWRRRRKAAYVAPFSDTEKAEPLLPTVNGINGNSVVSGSTTAGASSGPPSFGGALNDDTSSSAQTLPARASEATIRILQEIREKRDELHLEKQDKVNRNLVLGALFLTVTGMSIYTGIKCVTFSFSNPAVQGLLMAATVLLINLEFILTKMAVGATTKIEGVLIQKLHPHRLFFDETARSHMCDVCRSRIRGESYRCKVCDFDCCIPCYKKQGSSANEGLLRSDKGPKEEKTLSTFSYFVRAIRLTIPFFHIVVIACLCVAITQTCSLNLPHYQGRIIDSVIQEHHTDFWNTIKMYTLLSVLTGLFGGIQGLCVEIVARRLSNATRNELFQSVMRQDVAFFDGLMTGQITSRMTQDAQAMVQPCRTLMNNLFANLILLLGGLVMCCYTSWKLTVLAFTSIGPIIYLTGLYARWSRKVNRGIWQALAEANSVAVESVGNLRTVRAFGTDNVEISRYERATAEALKQGMKDAFVSAGTFAFTQYLDFATGVLILLYGGSVVLQSHGAELSLGSLITFQLYWNMMNGAYKALNGVINNLVRAAAAAQRVFQLLDCQPDIEGTRPAEVTGIVLNPDTMQCNLRFDNVVFTYQMRPEKPVLSGIDLDIPGGSVCAFVGRSGGGKSTLIHLLQRFYDPQQGAILVDGVPLTRLDLRTYRQQIGLVAQDTQLFANSIEENIAYGYNRPYTRAQLIDAAKKACAHDFIMGLDDGYETRAGERGVRLSGGQKQRIAIARVFLRKPRLLLLDEATSALDAESEAQVQEALDNLIKEMQGRCTVILVAHRLSTVINAHKIAVVNEGRIIEQGNHASLVELGGIYAKLVKRQMARDANQIQEKNIDRHAHTNAAAPPAATATPAAPNNQGGAVVARGVSAPAAAAAAAAGGGAATNRPTDTIDDLFDD